MEIFGKRIGGELAARGAKENRPHWLPIGSRVHKPRPQNQKIPSNRKKII